MRVENILKTLADKTRLKILKILNKKPLCVCKLPSKLKVSQPAISQHLKILEKNKLLKSKKLGREKKFYLTTSGKIILRTILKWKKLEVER
ncbi:MAG: metalloregulator ArsR/SmtB family transcription factor [Candidatus Anstonellaceae archaeon]